MSPWKTVQFGIVYNKLNNYNFNTKIQANSPSSITHMMANWANGYSYDDNLFNDPFYTGLFLQGELIYEDPNEPGRYYSYVETDVEQTKSINRSGQIGETAISISGNYDDMLYVGGTIGIQNIKYNETSTHYEKILDQSKSLIKDLSYEENFVSRGTGFNLKLGAIYLPMDWLRLGVAYHTRTIISLEDVYYSTLTSNDTIFADPLVATSPEGSFSYRIKTPSKTILSAATVIKKRAIISVDYEIADISRSLLKVDAEEYEKYINEQNSIIETVFQNANALRIGAEFLVTEKFVVRGGFAHFNSPIKKEYVNISPNRQTVSFGLGYRKNKFFWDVALSVTSWKEDYYLYDSNLVDPAETKYSQIQFLNTFGFRF
jgi:long-subunit fatty acid transport protein